MMGGSFRPHVSDTDAEAPATGRAPRVVDHGPPLATF